MGPFDVNYILNLLPHRYPFLLVDCIEELTDGPQRGSRVGHRVRAVKNVTFNEFFSRDIFQENHYARGFGD